MKKIIDAINEAAVSKMAEDMVFPTVRDTAIEANDLKVWQDMCYKGENEWMIENYWDTASNAPQDGTAKYSMAHPSGKRRTVNDRAARDSLIDKGWETLFWEWKSRTLLPSKYTSAKSTVKRALEAGVNITSDMGKTAMSKATKETLIETGKDTQDYNKEAIQMAKKLAKIATFVDDSIWSSIVDDLKIANVPF